MPKVGAVSLNRPAGAIDTLPIVPLAVYDFSTGALPPGVTWGRASGADGLGADGNFHTYANDTPVWDYQWASPTYAPVKGVGNGTSYALIPGVRLTGAQSNLYGPTDGYSNLRFTTGSGASLSCAFSTVTEAGITCVQAHITGSVPDPGGNGSDSYWYIFFGEQVAATTTTAAAVAIGDATITLTSAVALGAVRGMQIAIGSGATTESVKISSVVGNVATIYNTFRYAHASGATVSTFTGPDVTNGSSLSVCAYVRQSAGSGANFSYDLRVEGGGDTDTAFLPETSSGITSVAQAAAVTSNIALTQTKQRAYLRGHFAAANPVVDQTFIIGPVTTIQSAAFATEFAAKFPILNPGSTAPKVKAADICTIHQAAGIYDVLVETVEGGPVLLRGVAVQDGGYVINRLPPGCTFLKRVAFYATGQIAQTGAPPAWDFEIIAGSGEQLGSAGEIVGATGTGGITLALLDTSPDDEVQGATPMVENGLPFWRVAPDKGEYQITIPIGADGWDYGADGTYLFSFRSSSPLIQTLLGSGTYSTNDANNRLEIAFNAPLAGFETFVDHGAVTKTQPTNVDFGMGVCVALVIAGTVRRYHCNGVMLDQTQFERAIQFKPSGTAKVLFQTGNNVQACDLDFVRHAVSKTPFSPAAANRATADGAAALAPFSAAATIATITRATAGAQTSSGFTIAYDVSLAVPVTLEVSADGFAAIAASIASTPVATAKTGTLSWFSNKVPVTGLAANTAHQYRFRFADGRASPPQHVWTDPLTGVTSDYAYILMSCSQVGATYSQGLNSAAIRASQGDIRFVRHVGDLIYANVKSPDPRGFRQRLLRSFAAQLQAGTMLTWTALDHIWDDHDSFGGNNNNFGFVLPALDDGTVPTMAQGYVSARQVYSEVTPHDTLAFPGALIARVRDRGQVCEITLDMFSQRGPVGTTCLNYGQGILAGWVDQLAWAKAQMLAAGTRGRTRITLVCSSWDGWRVHTPVEWQAFVTWVNTTPGIPFTVVESGDIHWSYLDDGRLKGLPTLTSSPAQNKPSYTGIDHVAAWGSLASTFIDGDPAQFAIVRQHADGSSSYELWGSPHDPQLGATLLVSASTNDLILPTVGFRSATLPAVAGEQHVVPIDRSGFHPTGCTVGWSASDGSSGTLTFGPMTRTLSLTLATGVTSVTITSCTGNTLGQATCGFTAATTLATDGSGNTLATDAAGDQLIVS